VGTKGRSTVDTKGTSVVPQSTVGNGDKISQSKSRSDQVVPFESPLGGIE